MSKHDDAVNLIRSCWGNKGVWASSHRYKNQCWTRDFCMTIFPLMMDKNSNSNELFNIDLVGKHLCNIVNRQQKNGKIPILFLDDEMEFLKMKIEKSIKDGKLTFMLERFLDRKLYDLTPNTRDSEILFIIAATEFTDNVNCSSQVNRQFNYACVDALQYIESIADHDLGLIKGADWRDVREDLDDKILLTNAMHLYRAYQLMNHNDKAANIKEIIQANFWNGTYFVDYLGTDDFDILGNVLTIKFGVATTDQIESIFNYAYENLRTPFGYKFTDIFLPALSEEEQKIMDRDNAVIWPFISGFLISTMLEFGSDKWREIAREDFSNWNKLKGFNEWYDIQSGDGFGSENQVWSACLYLQVEKLA